MFYSINRKVKKPLKPKLTIQIASSGGSDSVPKPIQVLASHLCEDQRLLIVYGNYLKPVFEKVVRSKHKVLPNTKKKRSIKCE